MKYDVTTIALLGGHVALDFVNTVEDRTSAHPEETLRSSRDLSAFGRRHGLLGARSTGATTQQLRHALAVRGHLLAVLAAVVDGRPIEKDDIDALRGEVADAWAYASLSPTAPVVPSWRQSDPASITRAVAVAALDLLGSPTVGRIRRCANHDCGWYFLDVSKNGSRRWCSMAGCGTRAKSRRRRLG